MSTSDGLHLLLRTHGPQVVSHLEEVGDLTEAELWDVASRSDDLEVVETPVLRLRRPDGF